MQFTKRDSVRSRLPGVFCALLGLMSIAGVAQASLQEPVLADSDAPQVKALIRKAWAAESGKENHPDPDAAYSLYRKAGTFGSAEGYYRAGLIQLSADDRQTQQNALCLLSIASGLGHARAAEFLARQNKRAYCR